MSDLPETQLDHVLLRASDVERWTDERDELSQKMVQIQKDIDVLDRKLQAAALVSSIEIVWKAGESGQGHLEVFGKSESMSQAAERIVTIAAEPLAHSEVLQALRKNPDFRISLGQNPNYYYTMMGRLVTRERISKVGRKYGPSPSKHENAKDADHA